MKKIAFIFPGQGAQSIGMGKEIIENFPSAMAVYNGAKASLDFDLDEICFTQNEKINITEYTQPALLTISIAILKVVEEAGIKADYVAGLSLGEYSALVANGALDFEDAVKLVRKRGQFMEEAALINKGTMAAIMGVTPEAIEAACEEAAGVVSIANYNSPSQIVISGEIPAVEAASALISEKGGKVIPLKVSGAFHSELMAQASERLAQVLEFVEIKPFNKPYTTNVTGDFVPSMHEVKALLVQQVKDSVRWETCIRTLIEAGVDTFIEIGPGKTLSGLVKKIDRSVHIYNVEDLNSLNKLKEAMEV